MNQNQETSSSMEIESLSESNYIENNQTNEKNPLFSELKIKRDNRRNSDKMGNPNQIQIADNGARSQDSIGTDDNSSKENSNTSENQDIETNDNNESNSLQLLSPPLHPIRRSQRRPAQRILSYLPPFNPPFRQENRFMMEEDRGRNGLINPSYNLPSLGSDNQNQNVPERMDAEQIQENSPNELVLPGHSSNDQGGLRDGVIVVRTVQPGPGGSSIVLMRIIPMSEVFGRSEDNQENEESGSRFNGLLGLLLSLLSGLHEERGLDKETLESLPVVKYDTESFQHVEPESKKCSICFDNYEDGNEIKYLWCLHRFHKDCVDHWLQNHTTCPICKNSYSSVDKTELA